MKNNNIKPVENIFDVFSEFESAKSNSNFISYDKFMSSILLKNNIGFSSTIYEKFDGDFKKALENKYNILFENFIITFNVNLKYSSDILVPMITNLEPSNNETINFKDLNFSSAYTNFIKVLNSDIRKILSLDKYLEIYPNIIIFVSPNTHALKILFNKNICANIKR